MTHETHQQSSQNAFAALVALLLAFSLLLLCSPAKQAQADTPAGNPTAIPATGWDAKKTSYYENGTAVTGAKRIGKSWYAFNAKGKLMKRSFKLQSVTYYPSKQGKLRAFKRNGKLYYNNGARMTKSDALDFKCLLRAEGIISKITRSSDSMTTKRMKAFRWVMKHYYGIHRSFTYDRPGWPAIYATDHFDNRGGDCISDAAAFAYLAAAIGYKNVYVCTDTMRTHSDPHSWCMIGRRIFDPLFAQAKSFSTFYNSTGGSYEVNPTQRFAIPYYSPKHAGKSNKVVNTKSALVKNGLYKKKGSLYLYERGKLIRSAWRTIEGKTYYFTSSGKAATKSVKVGKRGKKTRYIFNMRGVLQKGHKTRTVTIDGTVYQVTKTGKAKRGWNKAHTKYFDDKGRLLDGVRMIKGKLFWFDTKSGIYNSSKTAALRVAAQNKDVRTLLALLGTPSRITNVASCNSYPDAQGNYQGGIDRLYFYPHIQLYTFIGEKDGIERFINASAR